MDVDRRLAGRARDERASAPCSAVSIDSPSFATANTPPWFIWIPFRWQLHSTTARHSLRTFVFKQVHCIIISDAGMRKVYGAIKFLPGSQRLFIVFSK